MSNFWSFLAGFFLADTGTKKSSSSSINSDDRTTNVPLQDVIFCQLLAGDIERLSEFVREEHPSPEQFIRKVLPEYNDFTPPYTEYEKRCLQQNENFVESYVFKMNRLIEEGELIDDNGNKTSRWEDLSAIRMIWQDPTHTPDKNHLDLLFRHRFDCNVVLKENGVIYEYGRVNNIEGMAKGFFDSIPSKCLLFVTRRSTEYFLGNYGYKVDWERNEGTCTLLYEDNRLSAYKKYFERRAPSADCYYEKFLQYETYPWSPTIKAFLNVKKCLFWQKNDSLQLSEEEQKSRKEEVDKIRPEIQWEEERVWRKIDIYKEEGKIKDSTKRNKKIAAYIIIALSLLFIGCLFKGAESISMPFMMTSAVMILGGIIVFLCVVIKHKEIHGTTYFLPNHDKENNTKEYLTLLQNEYYSGRDNECAAEYKRYLDRINDKDKTEKTAASA